MKTINGQRGRVEMVMDGKVINILEVTNIECKMTMEKVDYRELNKLSKSYKITGWAGEGSLEVYYQNNAFRDLFLRFAKTNKMPEIRLTVSNTDEDYDMGDFACIITGVVFTEKIIATLNVDEPILKEKMSFFFDGVQSA